ncbi:MAG: tetratricopeptide repeat protein [Thermodesulfobacteriota bacterium]
MRKIPLYAALILAIGLYCAETLKRNSLYLDEYALWTDTAAKSPHWSRARVLLGNALFDKKSLDQAIAHYKAVIRIEEDARFFGPAYHAAKQNLAIAYAEKAEYSQAIKELSESILLHPDAEGYYNLGVLYERMGRKDLAAKEFENALKIKGGFLPAKEALGSYGDFH